MGDTACRREVLAGMGLTWRVGPANDGHPVMRGFQIRSFTNEIREIGQGLRLAVRRLIDAAGIFCPAV